MNATLQQSARLRIPVSENDHSRGPPTAPVTLVEYGDFECPYCGEAYGVVETLIEMLGPEVRFVFRHFPLATIHPHAQQAAEAAEAAGAQGNFWPMHHVLYENQAALDDPDLVRYAALLELDTRRFSGELFAHTHAPRVRSDFLGGVKSGVNGTPTFYINELRHNGSYDLATLLRAVRRAAWTGGVDHPRS
jgi:protein-disulfide isomerase